MKQLKSAGLWIVFFWLTALTGCGDNENEKVTNAIQFGVDEIAVSEGNQTVQIPLLTILPVGSTVNVSVQANPDTKTIYDKDFITDPIFDSTQSISIDAGEKIAFIKFTTIDNQEFETSKRVDFEILSAIGIEIGEKKTLTITILDDDQTLNSFISIKEVTSYQTANKFPTGATIFGEVIMNKETNNLPENQFVLQDLSGGILIETDDVSPFKAGETWAFDIAGLDLVNLQRNSLYIPASRAFRTDLQLDIPIPITSIDLIKANNVTNQLVQIPNVYFKQNQRITYFNEGDEVFITNGVSEIRVQTLENASFANEKVPILLGTFAGIVQKDSNAYFLIPRDPKEFNMNQPLVLFNEEFETCTDSLPNGWTAFFEDSEIIAWNCTESGTENEEKEATNAIQLSYLPELGTVDEWLSSPIIRVGATVNEFLEFDIIRQGFSGGQVQPLELAFASISNGTVGAIQNLSDYQIPASSLTSTWGNKVGPVDLSQIASDSISIIIKFRGEVGDNGDYYIDNFRVYVDPNVD